MKKSIFIGILAIVLGSIGYCFSIGEAVSTPVYTGFIECNITKAMSQSSGKIIEINVEEGQQVSKGDLIAIIDSSDLLFQKDKIIAEIAIKENKLEDLIEGADANDFKQITLQQEGLKLKIALATDQLKIKSNQLEDARALLESNAISAEQLENVELAYQQAQTDLSVLNKEYEKTTLAYEDLLEGVNPHTLAIAEEELKLSEIARQSIERKIEETHIFAPSEGRIRHVYFNENEMVSTGAILADLLEQESLYVQFYVDEANFSKIELGGNIKLILDGSGETFTAKITKISDYAQFTPKNISTKADRQSLVFKVKADLEESAEFHSGMMVDIELEAGAAE
ncbi:HlyD family secretion protein [Fusibacter sp. 3D3]|uniref:HlyD family secretion protein n=1 Tax=Fusibacter sp. 3D3 TaxID=1048380 RepID=UPI000853997C|nr:HlyD family efflux transporter periplasmic adaptor subunit [Fusibacter sp. 3D3]GAU78591.1 HlyD family secretion protein [Fusibacter sp. 3D3]